MTIQPVEGLFKQFSLADILRESEKTKLLGQQVEKGKLEMDAFRKAEARNQRLQEIMAGGQQPTTIGQPMPEGAYETRGGVAIDTEETPEMMLQQAPGGPTVAPHVSVVQQLMSEGYNEQAQAMMKPHMDQFRAMGDIDKYGATDYYNKNIAPIMGTEIEYSEPDDWTTPQQAINTETGQPTFFSRNKKSGEIEFIDGVQPMPKSGWKIASDGQGGFTMEQGPIGKGGFGEMTKPVVTTVQKEIIKQKDRFDRLIGVMTDFKPEYLELDTRFENKIKLLGEKVGFEIPAADKKKIGEFVSWKRKSSENFNNYIREQTGAAMSESEAKRLEIDVPKAGIGIFDGDSPTEYQAKMDSAIESSMLVQARYQYLMKNGFTKKEIKTSMKSDDPELTLEGMRKIINDEAAKAYDRLELQHPNMDQATLSSMAKREAYSKYGAGF